MQSTTATTDFEIMPLGTGRELARLNDLNRELAKALATLVDNAGLEGQALAEATARKALASAGY